MGTVYETQNVDPTSGSRKEEKGGGEGTRGNIKREPCKRKNGSNVNSTRIACRVKERGRGGKGVGQGDPLVPSAGKEKEGGEGETKASGKRRMKRVTPRHRGEGGGEGWPRGQPPESDKGAMA